MYILFVVSILILYGVIKQFTAAGYFDGPNIAFNKNATQLPETYCVPAWEICYNASLAVDGITGNGNLYKNHCSHTSEQRSVSASLTVNLGKSYYITGIRLYNRLEVGDREIGQRLRNFQINAFYDNGWELLHNDSRSTLPYQIDIPVDNMPRVDGIMVKIPLRQNEATILTLCEVEIFSAWCPGIIKPDNGSSNIEEKTGDRIGEKITAGAVVHVSCYNGRKLIGPAYVRCLPNGSYAVLSGVADSCSDCKIWDRRQHRCEQITCPLPILLNGKYTNTDPETCSDNSLDQPVGCETEPNCHVGYDLVSGATTTCAHTGQWTSADAVCLRTTCNIPIIVLYGRYQYKNGSSIYDNKVYYNETVELHCSIGYFTNASMTRTCQADQTLSGGDIWCDIVTCGYPAESVVANGRYHLSSGEWFVPGHTVEYNNSIYVECNVGFTFHNGSKNRTCQDSDSWNGEGAVCAAVVCPRLKSTEHLYTYSVLAESTTFPYNTTVNITCRNKQLAAESEQRRCTEKGVWDGSLPECVSEKPDSSNPLSLSGALIGGFAGLAGSFSILVVVVILLVIWNRKLLHRIRSQSSDTNSSPYLDLHDVESRRDGDGEYLKIEAVDTAGSKNNVKNTYNRDGGEYVNTVI